MRKALWGVFRARPWSQLRLSLSGPALVLRHVGSGLRSVASRTRHLRWFAILQLAVILWLCVRTARFARSDPAQDRRLTTNKASLRRDAGTDSGGGDTSNDDDDDDDDEIDEHSGLSKHDLELIELVRNRGEVKHQESYQLLDWSQYKIGVDKPDRGYTTLGDRSKLVAWRYDRKNLLEYRVKQVAFSAADPEKPWPPGELTVEQKKTDYYTLLGQSRKTFPIIDRDAILQELEIPGTNSTDRPRPAKAAAPLQYRRWQDWHISKGTDGTTIEEAKAAVGHHWIPSNLADTADRDLSTLERMARDAQAMDKLLLDGIEKARPDMNWQTRLIRGRRKNAILYGWAVCVISEIRIAKLLAAGAQSQEIEQQRSVLSEAREKLVELVKEDRFPDSPSPSSAPTPKLLEREKPDDKTAHPQENRRYFKPRRSAMKSQQLMLDEWPM